MDKPGTSFFTAVCHAWPCRVCAIHIQYCWYPRYCIFGDATFKQLLFVRLLSVGIENSQCECEHVEKNVFWSFIELSWAVLKLCSFKVVLFFGPPDISSAHGVPCACPCRTLHAPRHKRAVPLIRVGGPCLCQLCSWPSMCHRHVHRTPWACQPYMGPQSRQLAYVTPILHSLEYVPVSLRAEIKGLFLLFRLISQNIIYVMHP